MPVLDGRYRLDRRIGTGGMSEVWCAHDEVLDRPVAIKLITLPYADRATVAAAVEQVRAEARAAARLAHPNIASVHDFGLAPVPDGPAAPYIVMELVDGQTLAGHLRGGALDWRIAARVCAEVSAALAAAHLHGIVHRDVKPANILLTPAGVKVLDFGIAAAIGQRDPVAEGEVVGTPAFVAPERLNGVGATPATDVYAVGVLLYVCLAGRLPWPVHAEPDRPLSHVYRPPEPLPTVAGLPADVAALCLRCLSADPAARPTGVAMALLLAAAVEAQVYVPVPGPDLSLPVRRHTETGQRWRARTALDAPTEAAGRHRAPG
ncbi:serine/threonine-protein kinase [Plantactinospora sp. KBS50]|uniref:serine/threonine-protein kinase n=1 Tax=Plantactinospora sp. KBS50 TaxID=2024580 RepID=UPI000BAAD504|nr:serine/threonine-protein kinase [Plantactinospora sp. KBS50]ASW55179.1 serine/threonine protein kinase [Plantactinospora sp. KBS50]